MVLGKRKYHSLGGEEIEKFYFSWGSIDNTKGIISQTFMAHSVLLSGCISTSDLFAHGCRWSKAEVKQIPTHVLKAEVPGFSSENGESWIRIEESRISCGAVKVEGTTLKSVALRHIMPGQWVMQKLFLVAGFGESSRILEWYKLSS